jgi:hypothetical protein
MEDEAELLCGDVVAVEVGGLSFHRRGGARAASLRSGLGRGNSRQRYGPPAQACYRASDGAVAHYQRWLVSQLAEERRRQRLFAMELAALMSDPVLAHGVIAGYEQARVQEGGDSPLSATGEHARGSRSGSPASRRWESSSWCGV